jgi:hypothetical protein
VPILPEAYDWDEDARRAAWQQARDVALRDPDAAAVLMAHLDATSTSASRAHPSGDPRRAPAAERPASAPSATPFDPMRLFARIARFYGWTHAEIMATPWRTLLGYAREAEIMSSEDRDAAPHTATDTDAPSVPDSLAAGDPDAAALLRRYGLAR